MLGALLRRSDVGAVEQRQGMSIEAYKRLWERFGFNGSQYVVPSRPVAELTALEGSSNPIVWACITTRLMVFADARFAFEADDGELLTTSRGLVPLRRPWNNGTQRDLLARMEVDASLFGNSYWVRDGNDLQRIDPTRVKVVTGSRRGPSGGEFGATLVGYAVLGEHDDGEVEFFLPNEVAHYRPLPDPMHSYRGVSWLNPILPDVAADSEMTDYKTAFLGNAAVGTTVITFDPNVDEDSFQQVVETINASHTGVRNSFKTLYLGGGADAKTLSSNLDDLDLKEIQGGGETRIASAAGVPAVLVGLSESLKGSSLTTGNYSSARRRFADGTIRHLWGAACEALETIVAPPTGHRLWVDEKRVLFMQEDVLDAAKVRQADAQTLRTLVDGGFDPQSAIDFVVADNLTKLAHTGTLSVQLQPPGEGTPEPTSGDDDNEPSD